MAKKVKEILSLQEVMNELAANGSPDTKRTFMKHGAKEPLFGVKAEFLKNLVKRTGINQDLALQLYETGNSDAMYLAGLMCDPKLMTPEILQNWAEKAYWYYLSEYTVAWSAADSPYAIEMALKWIEDPRETIASSGWSTLSFYIGVTPNNQIDYELIRNLVARVTGFIHLAQNRVRYTMNGFMISVGVYLPELTEQVITLSEIIGKVNVDMGGTACKVPFAPEYIRKTRASGRGDKKRKEARCA